MLCVAAGAATYKDGRREKPTSAKPRSHTQAACGAPGGNVDMMCAVRRTDEPGAADRRGAGRVRAVVLGSERQRDFRAAGVLRVVCIDGELSARDTELSHTTDRDADGNFWRDGVVPGDFWRSSGGQAGIPASTFAGIPDFDGVVFSAGVDWSAVAGSSAQGSAAGTVRGVPFDFAGAGDIAGEAECGGDDGARVKGECEDAGVLNLLHDGEHWRSGGPAGGVAGEAALGSGEDPLYRGGRCVRDVLFGGDAFSGAEAQR